MRYRGSLAGCEDADTKYNRCSAGRGLHPGLYIVARDSGFVIELFIGIYSDCKKFISLIGYKADI